MQVTRTRGLWASYRGALGFRAHLELGEPPGASPCIGCNAPCVTACPVNALGAGAYDVPACVAHLKSGDDSACLDGCLVRKSCPYGAQLHLPEDQRRFHIAAFLRSNG